MLRDLRSLNRKKYQRSLNKLVRIFNKVIENDWLWNGRFVMCQKAAIFQPYEDKSGAYFSAILELKDKKTGKTDRMLITNYNAHYEIWHWANECIVNNWRVWYEDPDPNTQARNEGRKPKEFVCSKK